MPVQSRDISPLSLSLLLADPWAKGSTVHSVSVDWGSICFNRCVALSLAEEWRRGASILGSSVCADIDLNCDYMKIILIGAITSLFSQDITIL